MFHVESTSVKSQIQKTARHVQESPERGLWQSVECEKAGGERRVCRSQQESGKTVLYILSQVLDTIQRET